MASCHLKRAATEAGGLLEATKAGGKSAGAASACGPVNHNDSAGKPLVFGFTVSVRVADMVTVVNAIVVC